MGIIFKGQQSQEFIFEEKGLLEISENKNPSKLTCYTVNKVRLFMILYTATVGPVAIETKAELSMHPPIMPA